MRWERVPILGNNPVFCFDAWRLWSRRTIVTLLLVTLVIAALGAVRGPAMGRLGRGGGLPPLTTRELRRAVAVEALLPPPAPVLEPLLSPGPPSQPATWYQYAGLLLMTLPWIVAVAANYLVGPLAAASLASDRAAGRLAPLLASQTSPRRILLGKLMAPIVPLLAIAVIAAVPMGALMLLGRGPVPGQLWQFASAIVGLFVAALVGLRTAAATSEPAVAIAISVLATALVLPALRLGFGIVVFVALEELIPLSDDEFGWILLVPVAMCACFVWDGLLLAALWFSTKRALSRAAE